MNLTLIVGIISVAVSLACSGLAIAFTSGKSIQSLSDHTASDERRFSDMQAMLTEMRTDIKEILKNGTSFRA